MADRATIPPTPPSSNAADIHDGFGQLMQHNSSFQYNSHSFDGHSQMSPGGSSVQGLDDTLYSNGGYQYGNGQEFFHHGLSPNVEVGAGYVGSTSVIPEFRADCAQGDSQYGMKHETSSRYAPVPDDPQLVSSLGVAEDVAKPL